MTKAVPGDQTEATGEERAATLSLLRMNQAEGRRELPMWPRMGAAAKPKVSNSGLTAPGTPFWSVLGTPVGGSFAASS